MSIWGRIFASSYDHIMARTEKDGLGARRRELLASATGDVLEIGGWHRSQPALLRRAGDVSDNHRARATNGPAPGAASAR